MMASMVMPASASSYYFTHGNNYSKCKCYAQTTQSSDDYTIGAQITWQLSNSNKITYAGINANKTSSVTSYSNWLWGKKGKSFGYYYINGKQKHKSTAWMSFDF